MVAKLEAALASIPEGLRSPLIQLYHEALSEYRAGRWEAVGVKVGKLCEVVFSIINGKVSGVYPNKPSKPNNMVDACKQSRSTQQIARAFSVHPNSKSFNSCVRNTK